MHICLCSWALGICKNIRHQTYFGSITAESVRFFHHFALCMKVPRLATFFVASKNIIFGGASFEPLQNLATLGTFKLQAFHGNPPPIPLLHPTHSLSHSLTHTPTRHTVHCAVVPTHDLGMLSPIFSLCHAKISKHSIFKITTVYRRDAATRVCVVRNKTHFPRRD